MIDVSGILCCDKDCKNNALFNYENNVFPGMCLEHLREGMDHLYTRPICSTQDCIKRAVFANKKYSEALFCEEHQSTSLSKKYPFRIVR
jgi:hypothetical protein